MGLLSKSENKLFSFWMVLRRNMQIALEKQTRKTSLLESQGVGPGGGLWETGIGLPRLRESGYYCHSSLGLCLHGTRDARLSSAAGSYCSLSTALALCMDRLLQLLIPCAVVVVPAAGLAWQWRAGPGSPPSLYPGAQPLTCYRVSAQKMLVTRTSF